MTIIICLIICLVLSIGSTLNGVITGNLATTFISAVAFGISAACLVIAFDKRSSK